MSVQILPFLDRFRMKLDIFDLGVELQHRRLPRSDVALDGDDERILSDIFDLHLFYSQEKKIDFTMGYDILNCSFKWVLKLYFTVFAFQNVFMNICLIYEVHFYLKKTINT